MKEKKKLLTKESLTPQQIYDLEIANRGWGLGEDVYFDGKYFKNWDGDILPHHPSKTRLAYCTEINLIFCFYQNEMNSLRNILQRRIRKSGLIIDKLRRNGNCLSKGGIIERSVDYFLDIWIYSRDWPSLYIITYNNE